MRELRGIFKECICLIPHDAKKLAWLNLTLGKVRVWFLKNLIIKRRAVMKKLLATLTSIFILSLYAGVCLAEHRHNNNIAEGRDVWFKSTFGGERFFSLILPNPPFSLQIGFDQMLTWPRDSRFDEYGVINDPDCTAGDASTAHFDRCKDPEIHGCHWSAQIS